MSTTLRRLASLCLVTAVGLFALGCEPESSEIDAPETGVDALDTMDETEDAIEGSDEMLLEGEVPPAAPDGTQPAATEPTPSDSLEPVAPVEEPAVIEEPATELPAEEPAVEEPATEPAADEPALEEPAAEEPAAEEPALEEPATEEPAAE